MADFLLPKTKTWCLSCQRGLCSIDLYMEGGALIVGTNQLFFVQITQSFATAQTSQSWGRKGTHQPSNFCFVWKFWLCQENLRFWFPDPLYFWGSLSLYVVWYGVCVFLFSIKSGWVLRPCLALPVFLFFKSAEDSVPVAPVNFTTMMSVSLLEIQHPKCSKI